jgi:hypothetical protein
VAAVTINPYETKVRVSSGPRPNSEIGQYIGPLRNTEFKSSGNVPEYDVSIVIELFAILPLQLIVCL